MRNSRNNRNQRDNGNSRNNRDLSRSRAFVRGAEGRGRVDQEIQKFKDRANRPMTPFRFWLPRGQQSEVMVLDESPDCFIYEHEFYHPERTGADKFERHLCTKEYANCPICERTGRDSAYVMFLTIIDFAEYTNKNGERVEWTRKLLAVKGAQQKVFLRRFDKEKTLRGAVFTMSRDGEKSPAIGNNIEFEEFEDIQAGDYISKWVDKEGNSHEGDHSEVYDYEKLFAEPDSASPRNDADVDPQDFESHIQDAEDSWDVDEDIEMDAGPVEQPEEKPAPSRRRRGNRG